MAVPHKSIKTNHVLSLHPNLICADVYDTGGMSIKTENSVLSAYPPRPMSRLNIRFSIIVDFGVALPGHTPESYFVLLIISPSNYVSRKLLEGILF